MSELGAYWTRTLRQFVGKRVRVSTRSGLTLEGVVADDARGLRLVGPDDLTDAVRPIPVASIATVESLE